MKIRICPNCDTHNASSSWSCRKCGQTLSMDSICELDDDLVNLDEPVIQNGVEQETGQTQSLLTTPKLNDLRLATQKDEGGEMAMAVMEEREEKRKELVRAAIRWNSWDDGFGTQARIVGDFRRAGLLGIEVLVDLLLDDNRGLKGYATAILWALGSPDAVDPLVDIYPSADITLKKAILNIFMASIRGHGGGLGSLYSPEKKNPAWPRSRKTKIIETFISAYRDDDQSVRSTAATGIKENMENWIRFEYDFSALIEDLIASLDHESEAMRIDAVVALGKSKNRRVLDSLKLALEDDNKGVRKAAKKAIKRLEKDLGSQ